MLKVLVVVLLYLFKQASTDCEADNKYSWSYHGSKNGPKKWGDDYPDCKGTRQSPVDINKDDTIQYELGQMKFTNFDKAITKASVQNMGWTVMIVPDDDVKRNYSWESTTYTLKNIHFHFNKSDHEIEGKHYPMEIHFYGYSDKKKESAITAVLCDGDSDDNPAFKPVTDVLDKVKYRNDSTDLSSDLTLSDLLPKDTEIFYSYPGSRSIPPCDPDFQWLVLKDMGKIGNNQLKTFMTLYSVGKDDASDDCLMGPNSRPVQPIGEDRVIIEREIEE